MPKRIQRKRTKGWRMPEGAVYVGRPTKWGNPEHVDTYGRQAAVHRFRVRLRAAIDHPYRAPHDLPYRIIAESIRELRGKDLVCWCPLGLTCHADVLLEIANESQERPCPIGPNGYTPAEDLSADAWRHRSNLCICHPQTAEEAGACGDELDLDEPGWSP